MGLFVTGILFLHQSDENMGYVPRRKAHFLCRKIFLCPRIRPDSRGKCDKMEAEKKEKLLRGWHKAVRCAYNWARDDDEDE